MYTAIVYEKGKRFAFPEIGIMFPDDDDGNDDDDDNNNNNKRKRRGGENNLLGQYLWANHALTFGLHEVDDDRGS